jgi:hypothetical protein
LRGRAPSIHRPEARAGEAAGPAERGVTASGCRLDWRLVEAGPRRLVAEYRLVHPGERPLWAVDRLVVFAEPSGFAVDERAAIVADDPVHAGRALLIRGYVSPESLVATELLPAARPLPPGGAVEGRLEVPWPLAGWHPNDGSFPLRGQPREAALRVGVLPGRCALDPLRLADGSNAEVPHPADLFQYQELIAGEPLPVPPGPG